MRENFPVTCYALALALALVLLGCTPAPLASDAVSARLIVSSPGLYRVTRAELEKAGLRIPPTSLALTHRGKEIPIDVQSSGNDFTAVFYADPISSPYAAYDVYWLSEKANGSRMTSRTVAPATDAHPSGSFPATLRLEEDKYYSPEGVEGEHWFWNSLTGPMSTTVTAHLDAYVPGEAEITFDLAGQTTGGHRLLVSQDGKPLGEARWEGNKLYTFQTRSTELHSGDNRLTLDVPGSESGVEVDLLDSVVITYSHPYEAQGDVLAFPASGRVAVAGWKGSDLAVYDVTDPSAPVKISGWAAPHANDSTTLAFQDSISNRQYTAALSSGLKRALIQPAARPEQDLSSPELQADYVVIAPAEFEAALEPLVKYRTEHGLKVKVVKLEDVFNAFSDGLPDPHALREFLKVTRERWTKPAPRFVLLVGKASYDYRDNLKGQNRNLLPTMLVSTPHLGEAASENWFVAATDSDPHPTQAIGRIPAKDANELRIAIDKIKLWEGAVAGADWRRRFTFVTDNKEPVFDQFANDLIQALPQAAEANRVFLSANAGKLEPTRAEIIRRWNAGSVLMTYIGHGSIDTWAMGPLFSRKDIPSINNGALLPVLLTPTCLDGYFYHPDKDSLAEVLLFKESGGVVAGLVPTGLSLPTAQEALMHALWKELFGKPTTLGEAIMRAKQAVPAVDADTIEVLETFTLLGDPALNWEPPQ